MNGSCQRPIQPEVNSVAARLAQNDAQALTHATLQLSVKLRAGVETTSGSTADGPNPRRVSRDGAKGQGQNQKRFQVLAV